MSHKFEVFSFKQFMVLLGWLFKKILAVTLNCDPIIYEILKKFNKDKSFQKFDIG